MVKELDPTQDTRASRLYADLTNMRTDSAGGVTKREIRELMARHGYAKGYSVESIIAHIPDEFPVWNETDEEREVWYHLLREDDDQWVSKRSVPKMSQPKKNGGEGERIRVDPEVAKLLKLHCIQYELDPRKFVEVAILEKIATHGGRK